MITVLIVDDQPNVRRGLRMRLALEPDLLVVGEAGDGAAAVTLSGQLRPDVVLMDVEMPVMDGIAAISAIRAVAPESAVIILSLHGDPRTRDRAREAQAAGFVEKQAVERSLLPAIRQAANQV